MEFEKIRDIIAEQLNIAPESITEETLLQKDLDADSLDLFQIISEIEEEFDIEFTNEATEKIKTVGNAVEYIKELKS